MKPSLFNAIGNEVRLLYHQLVRVGEELHRDETVTLSQRAVLEYLEREGASTVPDVARARGVSRQHIRTGVGELEAAGLVALHSNPAHRRSRLVALTTEGRETIARMRRREDAAVRGLEADFDADRTRELVADLRSLRTALAGMRREPRVTGPETKTPRRGGDA